MPRRQPAAPGAVPGYAIINLRLSATSIFPMIRFVHGHVSRTVLTALLLLATQFGFAAQACATVGDLSAPQDGCPATMSVPAAPGVGNWQPCGHGNAMPARTCITAVVGMDAAVMAIGSAPLPDSAPPGVDRLTVALTAGAFAPVRPAATARPPTSPAYILFRRFLS